MREPTPTPTPMPILAEAERPSSEEEGDEGEVAESGAELWDAEVRLDCDAVFEGKFWLVEELDVD
jgi:hypothetical protein